MISPSIWINFTDIKVNEKKQNIKVKLQYDFLYIVYKLAKPISDIRNHHSSYLCGKKGGASD